METMIKDNIARDILDYLSKYPDAADTIDGIMDWWIDSGTSNASEQDVQEVLDDLCRREILNRKDVINTPPVYTLKNRPDHT